MPCARRMYRRYNREVHLIARVNNQSLRYALYTCSGTNRYLKKVLCTFPISMTPVHVIQYYIRLSLLPVQQEPGGVAEAIPRAVGNTTAATAMAVPVFESHTKY